jgi:uncharacterized protein YndB with AHSA1/START domain
MSNVKCNLGRNNRLINRTIRKEITVTAPVSTVWEAWTTREGVTTFFAPQANVELFIGGRYEMLFDPEAPAGSQGGEGLRILSYLPEEMLSFEWNAPPRFPSVRGERTWVVVQFEPEQGDSTRVTLTHLGWREGEAWDQVYDYFLHAWDIVLGRLAYRFSTGPIDWLNPYTPLAE